MSIANTQQGQVPDRLRALFENLPDGVFLTVPERGIVAANPTACAMFGMTEEEIVRGGREVLIDPDDARQAAFVEERRRAGRAIGWELSYVRKGGERFTAETTSVLMDGGSSAFIVLRDLTAQKRAEAQLRASEAEFRSVFEQAAIGMGRVRFDDARWIAVNDAFCRMLGRSREEMLRTPWPKITHPDDVDLDLAPFRSMAAGQLDSYTVEKRFLHADGRHVWAKLTLSLVRDGRGRPDYEIAIIEDIQDRKQAEGALRQSEERLRSVLENMAEGLVMFDATGDITYQNPASMRIHDRRLSGERARLDQLVVNWRVRTYPDGAVVPPAGWAIPRVLRGERVQNERFFVDCVEDPSRSFVGIYHGCPVHDAEGRFAYGFLTIEDITEQARAEGALVAANEALRDADRRKDEFLGMLSHELRNPLAPVRNALYILDRAQPGGQQAQRAKEIANRQVAHLTRLVDDLLDVTRIARGKIELRREPLDLTALVRRTAEDYRPLMQDRGLDLGVDAPPDALTVVGDPARLTQILGNLLNNAAKFTPGGGRVTLGVRADRDRALVQVRDTGPGIAPDVLPTLFEPFTQGKQTLARSEGGLGLGLSLVKGLVALHGGEVAVANAPGGGAEFIVRLPLAAPPATDARRPVDVRSPPPHRRVLVIDDNRDAAETVAELARMLGHEVEVAGDAFAGLARVAERVPDVIFCDLGLPGMDGYEFARQVRAATANHPVRLVALSGYAQPEDVARSAEAGFDAHLAKPADPEELLRLLG